MSRGEESPQTTPDDRPQIHRDFRRATPLHAAAALGHTATVRGLLAGGSPPDARDAEGATPLLLAVRYGHLRAAAELVACGASVTLADRHGRTPAWTAAAYGDATILHLLVDRGAPSGTAVPDLGVLAAVQGKDTERLTGLLVDGADVDNEGPDGRTALHVACSLGDLGAVLALVDGGASATRTDEDHATPVHLAASAGHPEILEVVATDEALLVRDAEGRTPLHLVAWSGDDANLSALCDAMPDGARLALELPDADGWTALTVADFLGRRTGARRLVELGADPETADRHGGSALHRAVLVDGPLDAAMVAELANRVDGFGRTASHVAASLGHHRALSDLRAQGASMDARDTQGCTPLHLAATAGQVECVRMLLDAHASAGAVDVLGRTPVHGAAAAGASGALGVLARAVPSDLLDLPDEADRTPLFEAVSARSPGAVRVLLDAGADPLPPAAPEAPLNLAAANGDEDLVNAILDGLARSGRRCGPAGDTSLWWVGTRADVAARLLSAGARGDRDDGAGRTPLMHAARAGAARVVRVLLDAGTDPNGLDARGWSAVTHADSLGHEGVVTILSEAGADSRASRLGGTPLRSRHGRTPLHLAVLRGDLSRVDRVLRRAGRRSVDAPDYEGRTPLHLAANLSATACLERLLDATADAGVQDLHGITPMHLACWHPTTERSRRISALLAVGVDVTVANALGETALHYLARFGTSPEVEALLDAGAVPDARSFTSGTPLAEAASAWNLPVVRVLLAAGCDVCAVDDDGATPLDRAVQERGVEDEMLPVVEALLVAGADPSRPGPEGSPARRVEAGRLPLLRALMAGP